MAQYTRIPACESRGRTRRWCRWRVMPTAAGAGGDQGVANARQGASHSRRGGQGNKERGYSRLLTLMPNLFEGGDRCSRGTPASISKLRDYAFTCFSLNPKAPPSFYAQFTLYYGVSLFFVPASAPPRPTPIPPSFFLSRPSR
jgi:hypothetical protein